MSSKLPDELRGAPLFTPSESDEFNEWWTQPYTDARQGRDQREEFTQSHSFLVTGVTTQGPTTRFSVKSLDDAATTAISFTGQHDIGRGDHILADLALYEETRQHHLPYCNGQVPVRYIQREPSTSETVSIIQRPETNQQYFSQNI